MVHNFYQSSSPSGEDVVFRNEVELLRKNGIEVITYEKYNDEIIEYGLWNRLSLPFKNIWSKQAYKEIKQLIKKEKPNVAHFHNIWYLISPSAYYACKDLGVPVVQTLHNYRIFCANGLLMRDSRICEDCITGNNKKWIMLKNAFRFGCYRDSRVYTLPVAIAESFHWYRRTWVDMVDIYISLTEFGKKKCVEAGLPAEKIFVKPNFFSEPPEPSYFRKKYAVLLGRLSPEKGVGVLIDAIKCLSPIDYRSFLFKIIGDGPIRNLLENEGRAERIQNIEFLGRRNLDDAIEILKGAFFW